MLRPASTSLLSLALLTCAVGCTPPQPTAATDLPRPYIAFVGAGAGDPLWLILRAGAERFRTDPHRLAVRYLAPQVVSPQEQVKLIRSLLGDIHLKGLCVQVADPRALLSVLAEAEVHGVRVVSMVRDVPVRLRTAFCGVDEADLGRKLAAAAAEAVDQDGNIMVLISSQDDPYYANRLQAFRQQIGQQSDIHVLAYAECHGDGVAARRELRERSRRYPSVETWVMLDNWAFEGWDDTEPLLPRRCRLIAVDPLPLLWSRLESGECFALVGGEYGRIGSEAMRQCHLAIGSPVLHKMESLVPALVVRASELVEYRDKWRRWSSPAAKRPGTGL